MGATLEITLPNSWQQLTDQQLLLAYTLLSQEYNSTQIKTICLLNS